MDTEPIPTSVESLIIYAVIFLILLCCSAIISGSEVALFSLSQTDIRKQEEKNDTAGKLIAKLLREPQRLLANILIVNNLLNISITLVFIPLGEAFFKGFTPLVRAIFDIGVVTFFILLFGEILPKIYATRNNIYFSRAVVGIFNVLGYLFTPLSSPLISLTSFIMDKLGKQKSNISVGQLSQALELTDEEDTTAQEHKLLEGIISFGNTTASEVMRPRIDISALNDDMSFEEVIQFIVKNGYSRVPVYRENIDQITGVVYVKDLLPHLDSPNFDWRKVKRKAFFVPDNKKLDDLLTEFQSKKIHLAIVVDEYGGTSGVVTMEDIIEEIVGDISDEYDTDDSFYSKIDDQTFIFEGKTSLKDFYKVLDIQGDNLTYFEEKRGDSETLAGLILEINGVFPERKQKLDFKGISFIIEHIDKKRIKQIRVIINYSSS